MEVIDEFPMLTGGELLLEFLDGWCDEAESFDHEFKWGGEALRSLGYKLD